jgi:protein subunit release factor A
MIEKLEAIKQRYDLLTEKIADPAVIAKMDEWKKIAKERSDMEETVEKYLEYKAKYLKNINTRYPLRRLRYRLYRLKNGK